MVDNATRKLTQEGKRPVSIGFCFALGHSTVVILATTGVATPATALAFSRAIGNGFLARTNSLFREIERNAGC